MSRAGSGCLIAAKEVCQFGLHFAEMCIPMCVGFIVGDAIYFLIAAGAGVIRQADMALAVHGLMMPAMLIPMLAHFDLYAGKAAGEGSDQRFRRGLAPEGSDPLCQQRPQRPSAPSCRRTLRLSV
jgi:hypothetical protein